jgi:hypothetical protein
MQHLQNNFGRELYLDSTVNQVKVSPKIEAHQ